MNRLSFVKRSELGIEEDVKTIMVDDIEELLIWNAEYMGADVEIMEDDQWLLVTKMPDTHRSNIPKDRVLEFLMPFGE